MTLLDMFLLEALFGGFTWRPVVSGQPYASAAFLVW